MGSNRADSRHSGRPELLPSSLVRFGLLGLSSLAVLSLAACEPIGDQAHKPHAASGATVTCKLEEVKDAQRSGLVAYSYLVPNGWTTRSAFSWNPGGATYNAEMGAFTPDKQYSVDQIQPFVMPYLNMTGAAPRGMRLTHATDFLDALVDKMKQQGIAKNIQVVKEFNNEIPLTDQQKQMFSMVASTSKLEYAIHESGYLKVSFEQDGVEETADLGTTLYGTLGEAPAVPGYRTESGNYLVGPTLLIVAPTRPTAQKVREAQIVTSSLRMTPQFNDFCWKLILADGQSHLDAGNRAANRAANDWHERSMEKFRDKMAAKDAHCKEFCDYVLDQQQFVGPGGATVTLPNSYSHAWTDGNGQILVGNGPANPGGNWQAMEKKPIGG